MGGGGLCPRGSLSRESLSMGVYVHRGVSVWGVSVQGVLCLECLCPGGSLFRVSVWMSLSRVVSVQGVTVQGGHCPGGRDKEWMVCILLECILVYIMQIVYLVCVELTN